MNIKFEEMEAQKFFVVPIGNKNIIEEIELHPRAQVLKYYQESYNSFCLGILASDFYSIGENNSETALANSI